MRFHHVLATLVVVAAVCALEAQAQRGFSFTGPSNTNRGSRQERCRSCVMLTECPAMLRLLASRTRAAIYTVRNAICGYRGAHSMVCCPVSAEPPTRPPHPLLPTSCGFSSEFNRIFGGKETSIGAYPWVAALGYMRPGSSRVQFHCSASLISERYLLTAAHCLDPATLRGRRLTEIRLGDWDLLQDNDCQMGRNGELCAPPHKVVYMETAVIHPQYAERFQYSDDIALIRLNETLDLNDLAPNIHPVCLPSTGAPSLAAVGEELVAVGWGMTEDGTLSDRLQQLRLPVVAPKRCRDVYGAAFGNKQICAGGAEGEDTCSGDSGGPLIKAGVGGPPYQQVGVVSFGLAVCGTNNTPAVYTNVQEYRQWIVDNIRP